MALAATTNTVLLLLVSASRPVYGMGAAGVVPRALGEVGWRRTPVMATFLVVGVTILTLLLGGPLAQIAALTNAAVLGSFSLTNGALLWLSARGQTDHPRRDRGIAAVAVLFCGWLLLFTGWHSVLVAALLAGIGLLLGWRSKRAGAPASERG